MYENIDKSKYTPMMRQYLEIKEKNKDSLVFFRLGDFYEMFFNDALVASKELEIVLTARDAGVNNDKVPMCGVPYHAVNTYIERLTNKGYKVAIVEQLEEASAKKIVERDVIKIVTPGTNIDEGYLDDKTNNYIAEIEKTMDSYVLSYVDLSVGNAYLSCFKLSDNMLISELTKLGIKEVVVSPYFNKPLLAKLKKVYGFVISLEEDDKIDSYLEGLLENIEKPLQKSPKRLLSYLIKTQRRVLVHLQPFTYYRSNDFLRLDNNVVRNLELIESLKGYKTKNNLFACLDKCFTAMGSRFLKHAILFPLIDIYKIKERQSLISEFIDNYLLIDDLKTNLQQIYDLERIIGRICYGNLTPKDLVQLKKSLKVVPIIKSLLLSMKGKVSTKFGLEINEFTELYNKLFSAINDDVPNSIKEGGVIKEGYSAELDKIKNISSKNKDFLISLEQRERERTGIRTLKVGFNRVFGYYIEVTKSNISLVKEEFGYIRKQTTSNSERYITEELKEREALILRSDEIIQEMEFKLFNELRNDCKDEAKGLQILASKIAETDFLLALALSAKANNYVKPEFSLYDEVIIKEGRHPVIELSNESQFIPNDLYLYNDDKILLITGPNMSGKSTFMRQNAIIAIMAQMGSFVPCKEAKLPIFDQIFTRIGSSDDIASGESTFMSEMLEVNYALSNATERSLIILDEVGRGTATFDGMALAQAIIEYLHNEIGAKTLFSTHYHELTSLDESLPFLRNVHVSASVTSNQQIVFLHKIVKGPSDESYGINVASLAQIPESVTLRASDLLSKLDSKTMIDTEKLSLKNYVLPTTIVKKDEKLERLRDEILNLPLDDLRPIDALMYLNELKKKLGE